jgi:competence protein ComFC
MFSLLADLLFPKMCLRCGVLGKWLCGGCLDKLGDCRVKSEEIEGLRKLFYVHEYEEVSDLIKAVKYRYVKEVLVELMNNLVIDFSEVDYLVPVPLHRKRYNYRGFNQAEVIAGVLRSKTGIKIARIIERVRDTKRVAEIAGVENRRRELVDCFGAVDFDGRKALKGSRVCLVDDVYTTGATMAECVKVLKRDFQVLSVSGFVLAR